MLQQQQSPLPTACSQCAGKQEMLRRFGRLVHLLKMQAQRAQQSKSSQSLAQLSSMQNHRRRNAAVFRIGLMVERSCFRAVCSAFKNVRMRCGDSSLPFIALENIIKQASENASVSKLSNGQHKQAQTKQEGLISQIQQLKPKRSTKLLMKKIFELTHENEALALKLMHLQTNLEDNLRRQEREIAKKRQSLQGLAEELSQKNETIQELKQTVKSLQGRFDAKDTLLLHRLLEEDGEASRRAIMKLQNNNEKLDNQLCKVKAQKKVLEKENKQMTLALERVKSEIGTLKEQLFQSEQQGHQNRLQKRQLQLMSQRIASKEQRLKTLQKKYNERSRLKDSLATQPEPLATSQSPKGQSTLSSSQKNEDDRSAQLESKLEALFNFLFYLQKPGALQMAQLFDQEERELLLTHQRKYLVTLQTHQLRPTQAVSKRCVQTFFGDSLLQAFEEVTLKRSDSREAGEAMKLEIQRNKLIGKIGEMKERELHMRCVVLQLLRTLEPRAVNKDTQAIVTLLCQLFEYSEEQRRDMLQPKAKMFFGLL